jgi:hypothetical protein
MPLENSPSLDDFSKGLLEESTTPTSKKSATRILIYSLLGLFCALGIASLLKSNTFVQTTNYGSVSGYIVNTFDQPVSAEVFIPSLDKTCTADNNGYFILENIPAGEYSLIIGYNYVGNEYPISIAPGTNITLGELSAPEAHKPSE